MTTEQYEPTAEEEASAQLFLDRSKNPEYLANVLEHAAQYLRDGDRYLARNLAKAVVAAIDINNKEQSQQL